MTVSAQDIEAEHIDAIATMTPLQKAAMHRQSEAAVYRQVFDRLNLHGYRGALREVCRREAEKRSIEKALEC